MTEEKEIVFLLNESGFVVKEDRETFVQVVAFVKDLLENDLPKLYSLLYRIDIEENKAKQAFGGTTQAIAENLATLIVNRLEQKIESRKKYRKE